MSTDENSGVMQSTSKDPGRSPDPVIAAYKKDVDRTLLRANLKLTVEQRLVNLQAFIVSIEALRQAVKKANK